MKKLTITLAFLFSITFFAYPQKSPLQGVRGQGITVEPTFWWTNMHNPALQLMIYGKNIAKWDVNIDVHGISVVKKKMTDNPNYIFLILNNAKDAKAGYFNIELKNGRNKQTIQYELKNRVPNSANRESFSEKDNVYLIMPDRFANGNQMNDSIKGYFQGANRSDLAFRQGGDIEGMIQKIPYLADLGITALWTTPLLDNNDTQFSYHHIVATDDF